MNLTPPNDKIIIEVIKEEKETVSEGGIILGGSLSVSKDDTVNPHDLVKGVIVAAGLNTRYCFIGQTIYVEQCYTRPFNFTDGNEYKIVHEKDIAGIEHYRKPPKGGLKKVEDNVIKFPNKKK